MLKYVLQYEVRPDLWKDWEAKDDLVTTLLRLAELRRGKSSVRWRAVLVISIVVSDRREI